ncbi:MAG: hypothetical protein II453_11135 [Alphaproteobacteria bacterium]|nr:hypothetical protein [Alphaproteobacteria bacterium]
MIKIKDCNITPKDINILNSAVHEVFKEAKVDVELHGIQWRCQILNIDGMKIPVIIGQGCDNGENPFWTTQNMYTIAVKGTCVDSDIQLETIVIDNPEKLDKPLTYQLSPLHELYVIAAAESSEESKQKREPHSQLSACSKLIQEMYSDDPDYDSNMPVPKVFFSKLDFDAYMSNVSVTLEESILLWMESTGRLSVNLDDDGILVPTILKNNIKRVYMHGAARNQVRVELLNGDIREFRNMTASIQVEICNEILSILPPF